MCQLTFLGKGKTIAGVPSQFYHRSNTIERRVLSRMREARKRQARMCFELEKREHGKSEEKPW